MALIASATYGSYPGMRYEFYAEQTGGSGNSRTVKLTLKLKCGGSSSSSWYGYAVNWRGYVNGTWSGWATVKGTESWNATQDFRTYSTTITTDVGTTSSKAINVGFATDSQIDADWDFSKTDWNFNVGATNRAPSAPSNLTIRTAKGGASLSGIIPENINSFYIDWSAASDADGDTIYYDLQEQRNGGSWTSIDGNGTDCAHSFNTTGGEGTSYRYWVDARDSKGAHSANGVYSATVTKNVLTAGSFTGHSGDINFNTTEFTLNFNRGSNSNGSTVYMMCYSDNVTVHNATELTSGNSQTIKIWKSGATPSGPYIRFDDLKNYFAGSNYNGRLHVGLRTRNDYGTHKWSHGSIGVDLRVAPNPARNQSIVANSNHSPIYKKVAFSNNYYFIPDGSNVCRVHWNLGSGKLGESIRYEVYVSYNNGGWQKLADVPQGTNDYAYYNHVIPKQTVSQQFKYLIRTITSYGYHSDAITPAQTLHFYNTPGIAVGTITRGATTCDVKVTVKTNTSIPNVGTVGSWLTNPATSRGNLSASQGEQNIAVTGLTDAGTYTLKVTYNDNTGFSGNQVRDIAIGQNAPIFFVNKYGIGVNGERANSTFSLFVKGSGYLDGIRISDKVRLDCNTYKPDEFWVNRTVGASPNRPTDYCTVFNIGAVSSSNFQLASSYSGAPGFWVRGRHDTSGNYHEWARVYTTLFKPTAADVGAAPASHTHNYLPLTGGTLTGDLIISKDRRFKAIGVNTNLEMGGAHDNVFIHNTTSGSYLQFHNNGNLYINSLLIGSQHYPIIDRDTNRWFSRVAPVMGDGVMEVGRYMDFHRAYSDGADYTVRLDANNGLWCSAAITQGSDRELKENIKYLDDEPALITTEEEKSSTLFKDFIKDFKFATYNYIGSEGKCFGFIAQDIVEHPVGKLLLQEHEMDVINKETHEIEGTETNLAFGLADYTSVVAKALQEEIIEKDEKIIELEAKLKKQQKQIEKQQKQIDMIIGKLGL